MQQTKIITPGILLCLAIAIPAWILGTMFPVVGEPVVGILLGITINMVVPKIQEAHLFYPTGKKAAAFTPGIKYTSKKLLQYSIILLGFEMNLSHLIKVGGQSLYVLLFTLSTAFLTAFFAGRRLNLNSKMTILIGVGTSICGGSAIAATAPVIQAKDEDIARAISTIFLFNIIAVFIFPPLGRLLAMSDTGFGLWAGTAINDTSSVVAAGVAWSTLSGSNTALSYATIVKLTRTLMIVPITLFLAILTAHRSKNTAGTGAFKLSRVFPWFVLGFVAASVISTFVALPPGMPQLLVNTGKFMIVMAMTAIGLNTNLKELLTNGYKPIILGLCCWFTVAVVSLAIQLMMKTW